MASENTSAARSFGMSLSCHQNHSGERRWGTRRQTRAQRAPDTRCKRRTLGQAGQSRVSLLALAELAVVIGDLVLVALRHLLAAGTAHAAGAVGVFHLSAE